MHKVACVLCLMWFLCAGSSRTSTAGPASQATRTCPEVSIPALADWPEREEDAEPGLTLHVDVDGDGRRDSLEIALSSGSGSSSTFVDVERLGVLAVDPVADPAHAHEIPQALRLGGFARHPGIVTRAPDTCPDPHVADRGNR